MLKNYFTGFNCDMFNLFMACGVYPRDPRSFLYLNGNKSLEKTDKKSDGNNKDQKYTLFSRKTIAK